MRFESEVVNNVRGHRYLLQYPDGRYLGVYRLPYGVVDTTSTFRISDCKTKIILKTKQLNDEKHLTDKQGLILAGADRALREFLLPGIATYE